MERHQLEYFVAVVEHASFTRAAADLNVAQPSISRAMKSLERELGVELFRRTGREIVVTNVAWELARRARRVVHDIDALAAAAGAGAGAVGRVELATTPSTAIEPMTSVVKELLIDHPRLTTAAVPTQNAAEVVAAVDSGRCEVGLCGQLNRPAGRHIVTSQIGHDEVVVAAPQGTMPAGNRAVRPSELRGHRFVVAPPQTTLRSIFERLAEEIGPHTIAVEVGHREAILPMVVRGIGIALHVREWTRLAEPAGATVSSLEPAILIPKWLVRRRHLSQQARVLVHVIERQTSGEPGDTVCDGPSPGIDGDGTSDR